MGGGPNVGRAQVIVIKTKQVKLSKQNKHPGRDLVSSKVSKSRLKLLLDPNWPQASVWRMCWRNCLILSCNQLWHWRLPVYACDFESVIVRNGEWSSQDGHDFWWFSRLGWPNVQAEVTAERGYKIVLRTSRTDECATKTRFGYYTLLFTVATSYYFVFLQGCWVSRFLLQNV